MALTRVQFHFVSNIWPLFEINGKEPGIIPSETPALTGLFHVKTV